MILNDWRAASTAAVARLYAEETERWRRDLRWDIAPQWAAVEAARASGQLPGCLAQSRTGDTLGWSFYVRHRDALQVGALVADSPATTARLVNAILTSPDAQSASSVMMFGYFAAPGLDGCLAPYGYSVESYRYLQKTLSADEPAPPLVVRTYDHTHATALTNLLVASYDVVDPMRPFAKTGRREEWVEYVTQLTVANGCGTFQPAMSPVCSDGRHGLEAAALVTRIAPTVAHLAQVAVHPVMRGRKIGRQLVSNAMAAAARQGCERFTLLVSERNETAIRLYERLGCDATARFVSVGRPSP